MTEKIKCTYKAVEISLIPNTDMKILLIDGVETSYYISPQKGYKLHAKELDSHVFDNETMTETVETMPGFTTGIKTCHIGYDFEENTREFYAILQEDAENEKSV